VVVAPEPGEIAELAEEDLEHGAGGGEGGRVEHSPAGMVMVGGVVEAAEQPGSTAVGMDLDLEILLRESAECEQFRNSGVDLISSPVENHLLATGGVRRLRQRLQL
jgi:hypothetical protein